jgi:hypothetical protein
MAAYRIWWVSKDGKASIFGGSYDSRSKAEAEIPKLKTELLGICGSEREKADIESGYIELDVQSV